MNQTQPSTSGYIHSVETFGSLDGPGIRYVVFLQGCLLRCAYCHNPDTWERGRGKIMTAEKLTEDILRYRNFIASGGVTLSGGEPLLQPDFCLELTRRCKQSGLSVAIDTSGAVSLEQSQPVIDAADLLLLDIKAFDPALCQVLTGQDNRNALKTLRYCESIHKAVWIRHVLVPGVTLVPERLEELALFLKQFSCIQKVELLPFHKMGEFKWENLHLPYTLQDTPAPSREQIEMARTIFREQGFLLN